MRQRGLVPIVVGLVVAAVVTAGALSASAQGPKSGGVLNVMLREDLAQGFATHETATVATSIPSLACFNNLVIFNQSKAVNSA